MEIKGPIIGGIHYTITSNISAKYAITPEKGPITYHANIVHYAITPPKIGYYVIRPKKRPIAPFRQCIKPPNKARSSMPPHHHCLN